MKQFILFLLIALSANCYSQTAGTIIVDPPQLDSVVISGVKYYKLKTGISPEDKTLLNAAKTTADSAVAVNTRQGNDINQMKTMLNVIVFPGGDKFINASTYTITQEDNGSKLYFTAACNVYCSGLSARFRCSCFEKGGEVKFIGTYLSKFNRRTIQTRYGEAVVDVDPSGAIWLGGDLK